MRSRGPLLIVSTIAVIIQIATLVTAIRWGIRASLNLIPPMVGSLLAVWFVQKGRMLHRGPGGNPPAGPRTGDSRPEECPVPERDAKAVGTLSRR